MHYFAFAASHRPESLNKKLLSVATDCFVKHVSKIDIAEYAELDLPLYNDTHNGNLPPAVLALATRLKPAQGIIIASPEYNWSYPGSLKNIIDWLSVIKPSPLAGKSVLLLSATPGVRGGILGLQHLKTPLEALGAHVFNRVFPLGLAEQQISSNNTFNDSKLQSGLQSIVNDFQHFTHKCAS